MTSRPRIALLFAAFGALSAVGVFALTGEGALPDEAVPMIVFATLASALSGWLFAHKLTTPFRAFAILTGAVVMLGAQIPFALMTATYFWFQEPIAFTDFARTVATLIVGGWAVAGIFQTVTGGLAGWLVHSMGGHWRD